MTDAQRRWSSAALGGIGASFAMDVAQFAFATAFEGRRPSGDQDEETEAVSNVVAALSEAIPPLATIPPRRLGRAVHYALGTVFAAAYLAAFLERRPSAVRALQFGIALWLLSDRLLIPLFKLGRPWSRYSRLERTNALVSHLAYAAVVEYGRPRGTASAVVHE